MVTLSALKKEIQGNDIVVFLIPTKKFPELSLSITSAASSLESLCYVSLNKPVGTIAPIFEKKGIKTKDIIFIDAVTTGFQKIAGLHVVTVSSPKALTELSIAMRKVMEKVKGVVFDSLSTLLIYEEPSTVIKFSHATISHLRSSEVKGMLLVLKEDVDSELVKDLSMFVDKVVEIR